MTSVSCIATDLMQGLLCRLSDGDWENLERYRKILKVVPGLEVHVRYVVENHSLGLIDLATYMRYQDLYS